MSRRHSLSSGVRLFGLGHTSIDDTAIWVKINFTFEKMLGTWIQSGDGIGNHSVERSNKKQNPYSKGSFLYRVLETRLSARKQLCQFDRAVKQSRSWSKLTTISNWIAGFYGDKASMRHNGGWISYPWIRAVLLNTNFGQYSFSTQITGLLQLYSLCQMFNY